jgi:hypothetical protein
MSQVYTLKLSLEEILCKEQMVGENVSRVTLVLQLMVLLSLGRCKQVKLWKLSSEKKKQDEAFSVSKCLDEVDAMQLTDVEKAYAMNIFKSEIDREVFTKMKNKIVRLIGLKQQIR